MQRTIAPADALKALSSPAPLTADPYLLLTLNLELTGSSLTISSPLHIAIRPESIDSIDTYMLHNETGGSDGRF